VLEDGIRSYHAGTYIKALAEFDRAVSAERHSALVHYYRANTLMHLNELDEAAEEYKISYTLAPAHSQMADYCMMALLQGEARQAAEEGKQINRILLRQMVAQIQSQLGRHKQAIIQSAQANSGHHAKLGELDESRIREQSERDLADLENNPIPIIVGRRVHFIPRTDEMNEVRARAGSERRFARERAERRSGQFADEAARRQMELEKAASNLESQFLRPSASGVNLSALGTNLYVRNYAVGQSSAVGPDEPPPVTLVAKAKRLKFDPRRIRIDHSRSAAGAEVSSEPAKTAVDVRGKLIKH
jgi:tetratricopeptide (TPR) repeat protein